MKFVISIIATAAAAISVGGAGAQTPPASTAKPYDPHELAGVWVQQERSPDYGKLLPYTPEYAKILEQHIAAIKAGRPFRHDAGVCLPRGLIGVMTTGSVSYPIEIFQTGQKEIAINMETTGSFFRIHLDRPHKPLDQQFQHFFGDNVGHWEGDVLVVDSIDLGKMDTLDAQAPTSPEVHIVQKFHRTAYDLLEDQITLEDRKAWSHPVTVTIHYKLDPKGELDEVVCENERELFDGQGDTHIAPPSH
jgi:hypothetical protein